MARLLSLPVLVAVAIGAGENIRSVLPSRSFVRRLVGCSSSCRPENFGMLSALFRLQAARPPIRRPDESVPWRIGRTRPAESLPLQRFRQPMRLPYNFGNQTR
jgi:hypothetical protein